jgi:hypothetical protein
MGPVESAFPAGCSRGVTVAAAALVAGLTSAVAPSTVTGVGAGLCLLAFGVATLLAGGRGRGDPGPRD